MPPTPPLARAPHSWPLRLLLCLGCLVILALSSGTPPEPLGWPPGWLGRALLVGLAGLSLVPAVPLRVLWGAALPISLWLQTLVFAKHVELPLPLLDRVRVRGIHPHAWLLYSGLLLVLAAAPATLRWRGRRAWLPLLGACLGAAMVAGAWNQRIELRLDRLELPVAEESTLRVLEGGALVERSWRWSVGPAFAWTSLAKVRAQEEVVARIAQGVQREADEERLALGERPAERIARDQRRRAGLWSVQGLLTRAWLGLDRTTPIAVGLLLAAGLLCQAMGRPAPRALRGLATGYLRLVILLPPVLNLLLLAAVVVAGLADGARLRGAALGLTLLSLLAASLADRAGATT